MKGLISVLRHEIADRRLLLLAGALLGLLPLAAPLLPGTPASAVPELRDTVAISLALALSGLAAILLGATAIGSDLAERRLSFFFSRPLSGWAIWAGKLGGAALCAWAAGLLTLAPAWLVTGAGSGSLLAHSGVPGPLLALWAVALPLAILIAHAGSVILRTRSAWLVLDLLAAAAVSGIGWATTRRLLYWGVLLEPVQLAPYFAGAAGVALLAASAAQVLGGRTDPMRGHRRLSLTLASLGLAGALAFAAFAQSRIAIGSRDLKDSMFLAAAPGEGWIVLVGHTAGPPEHLASFLLQPATGRTVRARFAAGKDLFLPIEFSADGRRAVWVEYQDAPLTSPSVLVRLDLARAGAEPVRTLVASATPFSILALSPPGARVAAIQQDRWSVFDLDSGRLLAAAPSFEAGARAEPLFLDEDRLRILVTRGGDSVDGTVDVYDLDIASRKLVKLASLPNLAYYRSISPDGSHLAFLQLKATTVPVFDLTNGRQLAELRQPGAKVKAHYLADGHLVEGIHGAAGTELLILDGDGRQPAGAPRFHFPAGARLVSVLATPDRLLTLDAQPRSAGGAERSWQVLDLRQGSARSLGPDLELIWPGAAQPAGGSPLFLERGHLVRIDLDSGQRHFFGLQLPRQPISP